MHSSQGQAWVLSLSHLLRTVGELGWLPWDISDKLTLYLDG